MSDETLKLTKLSNVCNVKQWKSDLQDYYLCTKELISIIEGGMFTGVFGLICRKERQLDHDRLKLVARKEVHGEPSLRSN
ncbi:hypothetical protein I306_04542 [Cryptococcus gattii EJB2]|uniref:Uncharacterized protein n=1 Tax=Cryptococcus gattii EJB2 TaxID=1296103 RepID=A0ABR5BS31_9TREE|nr:hypothetical protein I306_04542 [Cryptococcus gattii EJB2]